MTEEERSRIDAQAAARDLPTSIFLRYVMAGACAKGGGTLDQLLLRGEQLVPGQYQNRTGRYYRGMWEPVEPGVAGNLRFKSDPVWRLRCPRAYGGKSGGGRGDKTNKANWWYLCRTDSPYKHYPMAWMKKDAAEAAVHYIEGIEEEAEAMKALTATNPQWAILPPEDKA
jgi:hypothetical protein